MVDCREVENRFSQGWVVDLVTPDVDEVVTTLALKPNRAHRIVMDRIRLGSRIEAQNDRPAGAVHDTVLIEEPSSLNHVAVGRYRLLLILGLERRRTHVPPDLIKQGLRQSARVQKVAGLEPMDLAAAELVRGVLHGSGWQFKVLPASLGKQVAREVVFVQPLHNQDDPSADLVVQACPECSSIITLHGFTGARRISLRCVMRVVDNDPARSEAGDSAAHRGREAPAALGSLEHEACVLGELRVREHGPEKGTAHHLSRVIGKLFRQ